MTTTRAAARQRTLERRAATERTILDSFESLLGERPFRDISVDDVMAAAGLSRTAFYRYFPDLEAVLLRLMSEVSGVLSEASATWLDGDDQPSTLVAAARSLAAVYEARGRLLLAFVDAAGSGPDVEQAWRQYVMWFVDYAAERIGRLRQRGLIEIEKPEEVAKALVWMTERYLLETFGRTTASDVTVDQAAAVLVLVWRRVLFGSG